MEILLYDWLFSGNAGTCRQIPQTSLMRDVEWASNTCTLTFTTVGIWPENADGSDINHCDRSHNKKFLVTADDFGKIKLFSYPVIQPKVRFFEASEYDFHWCLCNIKNNFSLSLTFIRATAATSQLPRSYTTIPASCQSAAKTLPSSNGQFPKATTELNTLKVQAKDL